MDWVVFLEPDLRDKKNELFKPGLVTVKGSWALAVDVTVRFESILSSLGDAAMEKVWK